ncbi:MAG: hypothetical protein GY771_03990 [bacterium]|nr:hypothetical protein [bacterium]
MRKSIIISLTVIVLGTASASAFLRSDLDNEDLYVTIKLNQAQLDKIANAGGENVTIKLTKKQINSIKKVSPGYKGKTEVELSPDNVAENNEVTFDISKGLTIRASIRIPVCDPPTYMDDK